MRVCVVGGGGREHVLAAVLARSAEEVTVVPGNAGIPGSVAQDPSEVDADLFVVGPEQPLVEGLADRLRADGRLVFGPGADGARLEGSKRWMKDVLHEAGVPTARSAAFTEVAPAIDFLRSLQGPWVVKTDGLAAGKGVLVTDDLDRAVADVAAKLSGKAFGDAGRTVVVEEGLSGPELSVLAVCDGTRAVALAPAQDHKRLEDGDRGPNTGGMGAYSPVPVAPSELVDTVLEAAVLPTLHALRRRGIDYRGVLYGGLMLTDAGPRVLEFNVRFGDPEAQVVLPRMASDLTELLAEAAAGRLRQEPAFVADAAVTVVCAAGGYPEAPRRGDRIEGLAAAAAVEGVTVYCAGVAGAGDGGLVTAGGRVLDVTALAPTLAQARERAYRAVSHLGWPGMQHRSDIAVTAVPGGAPPAAGPERAPPMTDAFAVGAKPRQDGRMDSIKVAVLMGSPNDAAKMAPAVETLGRFDIEADERVMSAHRSPAKVAAFAGGAREAGYAALICGAGMAAHLAGVCAAHTTLPVVGVPLSGGAIGGIDALYATVQMPKGIPVATVAIDGAMNAALLVVEMLAISDARLATALDDLRREMAG